MAETEDSQVSYLNKKFAVISGKHRLDKQPTHSDSPTYEQFITRLRKRGVEVAKDISAIAIEAEKAHYKDQNGWYVLGDYDPDHPRSKRRVKNRTGLTIDIDKGDVGVVETIKSLPVLQGKSWVLHQTATSNSSQPKYRLIVVLDSPIELAEYEAIALMFCYWIGMDKCDVKASCSPFQLMFFPVWGRNDYPGKKLIINKPSDISMDADAAFLDAYATLDTMWEHEFGGNWRDHLSWGDDIKEAQRESRKSAVKRAIKDFSGESEQANPLDKVGAVGDFCRAYSIHDAIVTFLGDTWKMGLEGSSHWYHVKSSAGAAAPGAKVYNSVGEYATDDDGVFFYSHHADSDPYCEMTLNAFDLVRMHKFGELDKDVDGRTKIEPSYKAMVELIKNDGRCKTAKLETGVQGFSDVVIEVIETEDEETQVKEEKEVVVAKKTLAEKINQKCNLNDDGEVINGTFNYVQVMLLLDINKYIQLNERKQRVEIRTTFTRSTPTNEYHFEAGEDFTDVHRLNILLMVDELIPWTSANIPVNVFYPLIDTIAAANSFDSIKDYFLSLPEWDGKKRVKKFFHRAIKGVLDNKYHNNVSLHFLTGAVDRTLSVVPSEELDVMPLLVGAEGIGKSSAIRQLLPDAEGVKSLTNQKWRGSDKTRIEESLGALFVEYEEFSAGDSRDTDLLKAQLTANRETTRLSYRRDSVTILRRHVNFGTTNEANNVLHKNAGQRRFAPIFGSTKPSFESHLPSVARVARERDQIWAEAIKIWRKKGKIPFNSKTGSIERILEITSETTEDEYFAEALDYLKKNNFSEICVSKMIYEIRGPYDAGKQDGKIHIEYQKALKKLKYKKNGEKTGRSMTGSYLDFGKKNFRLNIKWVKTHENLIK